MADLIYIGIRPSMDTFESNATNEQPGAMYGTYQATAMQVVSVAMSDNFTPGSTYSDDFGATPDTFTYNLGSGTITSGLDGEARFSGSVITAGSTTPQPMTFSVYQLQNGATFVRLPDGYEISQLTISSMVADGYDRITTNASSTSTVVCFVKGTWIETPSGHRRIEDISAGDLVLTEDRGPQRVVRNDHWSVVATSRTAPVHIASGALGAGLPFAPLRLSRQHRVYMTSPVAQRMFDSPGALVAAHHLIGLPGITLEPEGQVITYHHILCRNHELIRANGVPAETLLNAEVSIRAAPEVLGSSAAIALSREPVRPLLSAKKQRRYVARVSARASRNADAAATSAGLHGRLFPHRLAGSPAPIQPC